MNGIHVGDTSVFELMNEAKEQNKSSSRCTGKKWKEFPFSLGCYDNDNNNNYVPFGRAILSRLVVILFSFVFYLFLPLFLTLSSSSLGYFYFLRIARVYRKHARKSSMKRANKPIYSTLMPSKSKSRQPRLRICFTRSARVGLVDDLLAKKMVQQF